VVLIPPEVPPTTMHGNPSGDFKSSVDSARSVVAMVLTGRLFAETELGQICRWLGVRRRGGEIKDGLAQEMGVGCWEML